MSEENQIHSSNLQTLIPKMYVGHLGYKGQFFPDTPVFTLDLAKRRSAFLPSSMSPIYLSRSDNLMC